MAIYYLKNESGSAVVVEDLGLNIPNGQSIQFDENEINGYYTADLATVINASALVLSTTDIGDSSGDYSPTDALAALSITSRIHRDNPHKVTITQTVDEDTGTDITTSEMETLTDGSDATSLHIHDDRYYTESELSSSNPVTVQVHWDNITNAPQFGALHWREPVLFNIWEAGDTTAMNASSPPEGKFWWNSDDDHIYKYTGGSWVDQGAPVADDRFIYRDGTASDDHIYEFDGSVWQDIATPEDNWAVMVDDDGDGSPAQYVYDSNEVPPNWIKIADIDWGDHNSLAGRGLDNSHPATAISYDNTTSDLTADDVQDAIDELDNRLDSAEYGFHKVLYVDQHRTDTYTPTGSMAYPYKTIADAMAAATAGSIVRVSGGTYTEDFTIPDKVDLEGTGTSNTIIKAASTGMVVGTGGPGSSVNIRGISLRTPITVDAGDGVVDFSDSYIGTEGYLVVTTGDVRNASVGTTVTSQPAVTLSATATMFSGDNIYLSSTPGTPTILHNGGTLALTDGLIQGTNASGPVVESNAGTIHLSHLNVLNLGGGLAVSADNGATPSDPNSIRSVMHVGGINTGSAPTMIEDIQGGDPSGTAIILTPSTQSGYDNTITGIAADNVQDAIDLLYSGGVDTTTAHVYVDNGRTDSYTETGSILHPYKSIPSAISNVQSGQTLYLSDGTYTDDFTLPDGVSLIGSGMGRTVLSGNIQTGSDPTIALKNFSSSGTLDINASTTMQDVYSTGVVVVDGNLQAINSELRNTTATPLVVNSGLISFMTSQITTGDFVAIDHNGGNLILDSMEVTNDSATSAAIESTSGTLRLLQSSASNVGGGDSIHMNNGALANAPNVLADVIHGGEIDAGSAYTIVEGVHDLVGGARIPTGSNLIRRPAEQIDYDPSSSGLNATNVQTAIDELSSELGVEIDNVVYVAKNGSDTPPATGATLGTLANPYLTVQAAIDSITPASNNYQIVFVFPGDYLEQLTIPTWVSIAGMAVEPTRIGNSGTSFTHTLDQTGGGRNAFWNVNFRNNNFNIINSNGNTSVWMDGCVTGALTMNGLGYGDYIAMRNDCWIHGDVVIHGANATLYDTTFDGNIEIDGDSATNIWSGYTCWNTLRHCSIAGDVLLEETTDTSIWNSDIYGTITADGGTSGNTILSIDEGSAPVDRTDLIIQNGATLNLLDWAYAKGYDNATSGLTSTNVQDAIDELVGKVEAFKIPKGTAFPTSPAPEDGDLFYRTDMSMIFSYDGTRGKWLSTTEMFLDWGANVGDGKYLRIHGATATQTGYLMPRNGTIVNITAKGASGNLSKAIEIRRNNSNTALATFNLSSGSYSDSSSNIDFQVGDYIQAFASSTGSPVRDIVVLATVSWRD